MTGFLGQVDGMDRERVAQLLAEADDPAKALRLIVAAVEISLVEARSVAFDRLADRHAWRKKMADASSRRSSWRKKAELAVSAGTGDLEEGARLERQRSLDEWATLAGEATLIDQIVRDSEEEIAKLQILLRDLKSRNVPARRSVACQ